MATTRDNSLPERAAPPEGCLPEFWPTAGVAGTAPVSGAAPSPGATPALLAGVLPPDKEGSVCHPQAGGMDQLHVCHPQAGGGPSGVPSLEGASSSLDPQSGCSVTLSPLHLVTPSVVVRRVWIPWPVAVLLVPLFWLFPRRMGPHFAGVRWAGAIAAHLFWSYYGICWMLLLAPMNGESLLARALGLSSSGLPARWPEPAVGEVLRAPLAVLPFMIGTYGDSYGLSIGLAITAGVIVFVELVVLGVTILLMPYATAGERLKWVFGRSLRLTLWCSTALTPIGMGVNLLVGLYRPGDVAVLGISVFILWLISLLIGSSQHYAGKPEGTEWQPISPQCDRCGYGLTGLPYSANCPECGLSVTESFPDRRRPSRFAAASGLLGRLSAYVPTYLSILWGRHFFRSLRIRGEHPTAVRFAVWTSLLTSLLLSVPIVAMIRMLDSYSPQMFDPTRFHHWSEAGLAFGILGASIIGFLGIFTVAGSLFGYYRLQLCATVAFYWSAWLLPVGASTIGAVILIDWLLRREFYRWMVYIPQMGSINLYECACFLLAGVPVALAVHAIVRLNRAGRETRYANA